MLGPALRIALVPIATFLLSLHWIATATLARLDYSTHMPLAIQFFVGSLIVALVNFLRGERFPRLSLRLFQSAITVGVLIYFIAPLLCFIALRTLPSELGILVYAGTPLLYIIFSMGPSFDRFLTLFVWMAGVAVYFYGVRTDALLRGNADLAILVLLGYPIAVAFGTHITKRLFWTHSPVDLNFWSMLLAAMLHLTLAIARWEVSFALQWDGVYWMYLMYLAIIPCGLGYFIYRIASESVESTGPVLYSTLTILFGAAVGYALWMESPMNLIAGMGFCVVLAVIAFNSYVVKPGRWMVHFLHNDTRQGDRLVCHIDGVMKLGDVGTPMQVIDISIGGLGFRSESGFDKGEKVLIVIPIGSTGSQVSLECTIAHIKAGDSRAFPWMGGVNFTKMNAEKVQHVVEFLAKLSKAHEM